MVASFLFVCLFVFELFGNIKGNEESGLQSLEAGVKRKWLEELPQGKSTAVHINQNLDNSERDLSK